MRRKQIRVVGNCQAWAMARFYQQFVGAPNGEDVDVVDDLGMDVPALQAAVQGADVVIVQERDFKHGLSKEELGGNFDVYNFPLVMAGFMWPFANEPHVHNVSEKPISDGPYPSQMGDSYLNRLIREGVSPEEALDRYLSLDIAKAAHLDRLMEVYLDKQRQRDAATGFDVASSIEAKFRTEKLFLTAEHPDAWLFGLIAKQLFDSMNVSSAVTQTALGTLTRSPFPPTELPLHPGVIAHFGLSFAREDDLYTYEEEGRFTFREHVLRYMRCESNPKLREALYMANREDPSLTVQRLDAALVQSPVSAAAHRTRGAMLAQLSRLAEAEAAYREAIRLDPQNPDLYVDLARTLSRSGEWHRAEDLALVAVEKEPRVGAPHVMLCEARMYGGRCAEALEPGLKGVQLSPGNGHAHRMYAMALHGAGQPSEAEIIIRRAILIEPGDPDHRNLLGETLEGQGRRDDAIQALEQALLLGVKNDQTYSLLGNFLMRGGHLARAEAAFAEGADLYGHYRTDLRDCMVQVQQMRAPA